VFEDEQTDEFASYFNRSSEPKVLITTTQYPSQDLIKFALEMKSVIGWDVSEYRKRTPVTIKDIVNGAIERDFTDLMVISESKGKPRRFFRYFSHSVITHKCTIYRYNDTGSSP
jgi:ribosome production factor 1